MLTRRSTSALLTLLAVSAPWSAGCRDCFSEKNPGSCLLDTSPAGADDSGPPPTTPHEILETYCWKCHGQEGTIEGGMNYILSLEDLIANNKVKPGDATGSRLYQRMADGTMPPAGNDAPSDAEIDIIKEWIDGGATSDESFICVVGERTFITNDDLFQTAYTDLQTYDDAEKPFVRYISFAHLYNAGVCDDQLDTFRVALSKAVNNLSWKAEITNPIAVDANQVIYRIDLRDYRWEPFAEDPFTAWEYVVSENPYAFNYGETYSVYNSLREGTRARTPIVNGDWFVKVAAAPPLYHEILDIPTNVNDWLAQFGVDVELNVANYSVDRAGFKLSGVSFYNRLIERHDAAYGYCWVSYDFAGDEVAEDKSLCNNPIDPEYDGGEMFCSLPNHMQAYYLAIATGERIDVGPSAVVNDPNRAYDDDFTSQVVNGVSCNNCHYMGVIPKADIIAGDDGCAVDSIADRNDLDLVELLYAENGDEVGQMGYLQSSDSEYFLAAVDEASVPRVVENIDDDLDAVEAGDGDGYLVDGEPVFALSREFDEAVNLARAMAELGLEEDELDLNDFPDELKDALEDLDSGNTVSRKEFLSVAGELICYLETGAFDGAINDNATSCDEAGACGPSGLACLDDQYCIEQTYAFIDPDAGELVAGVIADKPDNNFDFGLCAECLSSEADFCDDGADNDCDGDADSADTADCP